MQISNISRGIPNLPGSGNNRESQEPAEAPLQAGLVPHTSPASGTSSVFREILARYDVHQISPREFSQLSQELFEAGAISPAQLKELAEIRLELDLGRAEPDEPMDLLKFFEEKLHEQEEELAELRQKSPEAEGLNLESYLGNTRRQLEWLRKFAIVHAGGLSEAIDAQV